MMLMMNLFDGTFLTTVEPWFSNMGMVGGLVGGGVGVLGGLYGTLIGILAPRGKAKSFMFAFHWLMLAIGIAMIYLSVYALMTGQPYGVWYGLGLPGLIVTALMITFTPMLKKVYRAAEQRQLEAQEFLQS